MNDPQLEPSPITPGTPTTVGDPLRGRFVGGIHPALDAINRSLPFDRRLWREDLAGSRAHARMLGQVGVLEDGSVGRILRGLEMIEGEFDTGTFVEQATDEDIHMAVERRLVELIGEDGRRLHTGRSRNDQVATDVALHLRWTSETMVERVADVQRSLVALATQNGGAILPFYTHLQRAQPMLLGHVLLAYVEMLESDRRALIVDEQDCPLGSGAGAGTTFPIDREATADELGFARPAPNSLAATASRQEAARFASSLASCAVTLSRLGADIVLWTSREFGFARLGDAVSTGSSIMPQKRNPDGAELLRAQATRVVSAASRLLEVQRGLSLGYHKDLQEDKPALFEAEDTVANMLAVAEAMLGDLHFDPAAMRAAVDDPAGFVLATEAADALVRRGVSFREAHEAVGQLVSLAESRGVGLSDLSLEEMAGVHAAIDVSVKEALDVETAVAARAAVGGTAPHNVAHQLAEWTRRLSTSR